MESKRERKRPAREAEGKSRQSCATEAEESECFKRDVVDYVKCCLIAQGNPAKV